MLSPEAITLQEAEPIRMLQIDVSRPQAYSPALLASASLPRVLPSLSPFPLSLPQLGYLDPVLGHASQTRSLGSTFFFQKWRVPSPCSSSHNRVNETSQRLAVETWTCSLLRKMKLSCWRNKAGLSSRVGRAWCWTVRPRARAIWAWAVLLSRPFCALSPDPLSLQCPRRNLGPQKWKR